MKQIVRSRAPLRLGLAGGGTDVSPYSDQFGGCILNATIDLYAHCTIVFDPQANEVTFKALDLSQTVSIPLTATCALEEPLLLHRGIYNRIVHDFNNGQALPVTITTWSDAPPGSGLGTSSTLVVAILAAFQELLRLPLGEYDLAHLAYQIERIDCGLAGGKQDQYAATFGGFNFMEFYRDDRVIVNPLRIRRRVELELESSLLLYFTGQSRESAHIIKEQVTMVEADGESGSVALKSMHLVKEIAYAMKEAILKGDIANVHQLLGATWEAKKRMAKSISTSNIESVAATAMAAGAKAIKVSGAGGGGFMMIFVEPTQRRQVIDALSWESCGAFHNFCFTATGVETWKVK